MDINTIKEYYKTVKDEKLELIALTEAKGLKPETIPILIAEIEKRGLDPSLLKAIEAQTKKLTEAEIKAVESKIVNLPCPECGKNDDELEGSIIRTVMSFILFTSYKKRHIISCNNCKNRLKKNALTKTVLLGWWGIPWGIVRTPHAIIMTLIDNNKGAVLSKSVIDDFIGNNIGIIKASWESQNELEGIIKSHNNNE